MTIWTCRWMRRELDIVQTHGLAILQTLLGTTSGGLALRCPTLFNLVLPPWVQQFCAPTSETWSLLTILLEKILYSISSFSKNGFKILQDHLTSLCSPDQNKYSIDVLGIYPIHLQIVQVNFFWESPLVANRI